MCCTFLKPHRTDYSRGDVELGKTGKLQGTIPKPQPLDSFMIFAGE